MPVTYEQATANTRHVSRHADHPDWFTWDHHDFHTPAFLNADGTPQRWRRNGATKTWKTRPGVFRIPVKRGLREYFYITDENAADFEVGTGE